ncbi:MAG TPA: hypothetical protein VJH97_07000 [Candidatus Nanoarchaeia archaeon]|nr:hypothetical protein [Candidatus Nanoarchaeia archaeon]
MKFSKLPNVAGPSLTKELIPPNDGPLTKGPIGGALIVIVPPSTFI